MKKIILYVACCLLGICILNNGITTIQAQNTAAEKSASTKNQRNFSKKSKNPVNTLSRGGHLRYPHGLDKNKSINMGYQLGASLALNDALKEERCAVGANLDLYMHFILKKTHLLAIGPEIKAFYFMSNANNFTTYNCPAQEEGLETPEVTLGNWIAGSVQFSMLTNFNATARCNIQLKANVGPLMVMVPENHYTYQISEIQLDNSTGVTKKEFKYNGGMTIGGAGTLGADLLYALSANTELKGGIDWTYMRFAYDKECTVTKQGQEPVNSTKHELRQFGVFNFHIGFAHSF